MSDWICVADELPGDGQQVLGWVIDRNDGYSKYALVVCYEGRWFYWEGRDVDRYDQAVTHWANLPPNRSSAARGSE